MRQIIIIFVIALLGAVSCKKQQFEKSQVLTVSIEPQRFLLEQIAGSEWSVNTLLAGGEDPENFDPPVSVLKSMSESQAYFKIGTMAFENSLIERVGKNQVVVDCSKGIEVMKGTHSSCHSDNSHEHEADPHIWTSLKNMKIMAENMLNGLLEVSPADSSKFRRNYETLIRKIDSCDSIASEKLISSKGECFLVWHPSLSYFARDYGLTQMSIGHDNKEMSVSSFKQNVSKAKEHSAKIFFVQPDFDAGKSKSVAAEAGAVTYEINTMTYDLPAELLRIAEIISNSTTK